LKGCETRLNIPKTFSFSKFLEEEAKAAETVKIKMLGGAHSCKYNEESVASKKQANIIESSSENILNCQEKDNDEQIKLHIKENLLKGVLSIKEWCKLNKIKATKYKIKYMLSEIRKELFPNQKEIILSKPFSQTKGELGSGFNLCRFKGSIFDSKEVLNEVIIFSSPCLLRLLKENNWFIDGTFKVAAQGYRQLLINCTSPTL